MADLPSGAVIDTKTSGLPAGAVVDAAFSKIKPPPPPWEPSLQDNLRDRGKLALGVADVALTAASAGVAELMSGLHGMVALALSGDPDYAKERVESMQNFLTIGPFSEGGQYLLQAVTPAMSKADTAINDYAEEKSKFIDEDGQEQINPEVATAIKTGIWGSIDIVSAAVPGAKAVINAAKIRKMRNQVIAETNRLGIDIHLDHFADDVAAAAKLVGSESAGEAATEYVTALRNAENLARIKKNSLYAAALDEKLFVETRPIRRMGAELTRELDGRFDLDAPGRGMALVRRALDNMHTRKLGFAEGQGLAVHFNKFEQLRKRLNNSLRDTAKDPKSASAHAALTQIKTKVDSWMTSEFNKLAIDAGDLKSTGGALSGDAAGYIAYLDARKANVEFAWFNDTKIIADLIKKDTSVDQFAQWLIGSSAMGKRGSAAVVNKLKLLLGEDSPAIAAVRADFVYQLTEPLLQLEPNFRQFANNYDKVLRKNKPLADALELQKADVAALAAYADVARQLPPSGHFYSLPEVLQTIARLSVGHGVAKGAARVGFVTKSLNVLGRVDAVTQKQILAASIDARFDQPLIPKRKPVYAVVLAAAALTGIVDETNK